MIRISRNREFLVTSIKIDVPRYGAYEYHFQFNAGKDQYAAFVADAIEYQIFERLENIRREAYEQGWKDAKAKRKKQTFFSCRW